MLPSSSTHLLVPSVQKESLPGAGGVFLTRGKREVEADNTSEDEEPIKKLRVTSKWMSDQPSFKITQRLGNFEGAMQQNFQPKRGKSNLTKFQAQILQEVRSNKHIIIAHANKNLGPIGIDTERDICWAHNKHLLNANTYIQESEEEA